ncbi:hypothetical protein [Paraburkholderia sp. J41]|uniref:hypothetical protein n=1 Tax=Paraburkholderia sp. J41 TaxID=2805433 RepID=UPI002AC33E5E|nr:hypothetical protein [Paraburkholderia sp. J41]
MKKKRKTKSVRARPGNHHIWDNLMARAGMKRPGPLSFENAVEGVKTLFSRYSPEEVCVAIGVWELWLPNVSAQVKQSLAWRCLLAMNASDFSAQQTLANYGEFKRFCTLLNSSFPSFATLEDFVPIPDWRSVKSPIGGSEAPWIFYGGLIERPADFIEAFRLSTGGLQQPLADMDWVLRLQNFISSSIEPSVVGDADNIESGHVETPDEGFWRVCRSVLEDCVTNIPGTLADDFKFTLGHEPIPLAADEFYDAVQGGSPVPCIWVEISGKTYPVFIRNAYVVVLEYWAKRTQREQAREGGPDGVHRRVGLFLAERFRRGTVIPGPLNVVSKEALLSQRIAAVLLDDSLTFVIAIHPDEVARLPDFERELFEFTQQGREWALLREGQTRPFQLRKSDGATDGSDIKITAVIESHATGFAGVPLPKTQARVVWLPDFVTLYDSVESLDEASRFWTYVDANVRSLGPFSRSVPDIFAAFKDTHGVLVDGAVQPNLLVLDPHWGSRYRYTQLEKRWKDAPPVFPNDRMSAWSVERTHGGLYRLESKTLPELAYGARIGECMLYFVASLGQRPDKLEDGRLLAMFAECAADSAAQRITLIDALPLFKCHRIAVTCEVNPEALASLEGVPAETVTLPLLGEWRLENAGGSTIALRVKVNVARLQASLGNPTDARFEVECLIECLKGIVALVGETLSNEVCDALNETAARAPRFFVETTVRDVDVPDAFDALIPEAEQYKVARRELAFTFQRMEAQPGRYMLADAKPLIDAARDRYRAHVHQSLMSFDRDALLRMAVEEYDHLATQYRQDYRRIKQSLKHETDYDRQGALAEKYEEFSTTGRNYRYLIEATVSAPSAGSEHPGSADLSGLLARVDWLFVLYGASDSLHNDVAVAGLELDDMYVPHVFYSDEREVEETAFRREIAESQLGLNRAAQDEVAIDVQSTAGLDAVDEAFERDIGFTLRQMITTLSVLSQWASANDLSKLAFRYEATADELSEVLKRFIEGVDHPRAERIIEFLTLHPREVRVLLGKTVLESDVPVWEHTKRSARLNLRPLIELSDGRFTWGASAAERSSRAWVNAIINGYLPADFPWVETKKAVQKIKNYLEKELEKRAAEICARTTKFFAPGIDFMRRFPNGGFVDVGDFDVLAYWPETNTWLSVECKYNQPPFCLKDARRLRERIFGVPPDRAQFAKIEGRRAFLQARTDELRTLLGWPEPTISDPPRFLEAYVCRDIYWWMRFPPYPVPTEFVRVDSFDKWLRCKLDLGNAT